MVTVTRIIDSKTEDLQALRSQIRAEYEGFRARKLALDMTRGKPSPEQLDLANALLSLPGDRDYFSQAKEDVRNYGSVVAGVSNEAFQPGQVAAASPTILL